MKKYQHFIVGAICSISFFVNGISSAASENFKVFLCFGQSNMSGGSGCNPDDESQKKHPQIKVLAFHDCTNPQRTKNQWYDAFEPMHCGDGINAMGPSYAFGQALIDSLDPTDTIGLIPAGLWGVSIEMFMKGKTNTSSSKPNIIGNNAWDWMVTKCKEAMKRGIFTGIILHQGESNTGQQDWPDKVAQIYNDLKKELELNRDFPLVAGELLYTDCCSSHNAIIAKLPQKLPFAYVASAEGLQGGGSQPQYHFNTNGYREMGKRMAKEMMKGIREVEKTYAFQPKPRHRIITSNNISKIKNLTFYSLDGKFIAKSNITNNKSLNEGNLYIVTDENSTTKFILIPSKK